MVRARSNGIATRSCSVIARSAAPGAPPRSPVRGQQHASAARADRQHPRLGPACGRFAPAPPPAAPPRRAGPTGPGLRWRRAETRRRAVRSVSTPDRSATAAERPQRRLPGSCRATPPGTPGSPISRSPNRNEPVRLPISSRFVDGASGLGLLARVCGQLRSHAVGQEQWRAAAELTGPFHGVLGDQVGVHEVAPPYRAHHDVLGDEDVLALLALLQATPADRLQLLSRRVELAGPFQQQRVLHVGTENQGREGMRILQLQCTTQTPSSIPSPP